ncbi:NAD(P)/FAD-dependent oxidoreductase [Acanthopleuribacter pedis]|uniref:Tryptophan 7-halogenase n=1 Tax=Acanthopleuribacter pedis TaxID=442870 RepID=A0A8J7QB12_9BACT|nr:tryptophan 7-halogenase [Acanthopleuribacter pedis]MBO1321147.1 tryptophan 7-halogenase [Acanthopleuribacter pedis]
MADLVQTDVAVIGAGIAGCIAALALAPTCRVLLVDRQAEPPPRIGECLPPAARRILEALGLSETLTGPNSPHQCSLGMQSYWGSSHCHINDHLRNPDGAGYHLDRAAFEGFLRARAEAAGAVFLRPATFQKAETEDDGLRLHLLRGGGNSAVEQRVHTRYVIDAGGRTAPFAKRLPGSRIHLDRLTACWATIPNRDPRKMGLILAAQNGWWYSAPLPNGRRVLAYQSDSDLINSSLHREPAAFLDLAGREPVLAELTDSVQTDLVLHGMVAAGSSRLPTAAGAAWAAVGDAACAFDPLSSQGMFHAMATAMQLGDLLKASRRLTHPNAENTAWVQQQYRAQIERVWQGYQTHRLLFYGMERRFCHAPFWQRRHATVSFMEKKG